MKQRVQGSMNGGGSGNEEKERQGYYKDSVQRKETRPVRFLVPCLIYNKGWGQVIEACPHTGMSISQCWSV